MSQPYKILLVHKEIVVLEVEHTLIPQVGEIVRFYNTEGLKVGQQPTLQQCVVNKVVHDWTDGKVLIYLDD